MLIQYSYNSKKNKDKINDLVGKSFSLLERLKMSGIGSQRLVVEDVNLELLEILNTTNSINYTNIELRKKGVIIWFRVKQESWILAFPYFKLSVYKNGNQLSLYCDQWKVYLKPFGQYKLDHKFVKKLLEQKVLALSA